MIKKITITILGIGLLLAGLAFWGPQAQAAAENPQDQESIQQPAQKPTIQAPVIQDALILHGWKHLRSLKEPIQVGNGMTVSGESLAQFLLKSQIPVVWGSDEICGGGSCSRQYCSPDGQCSFEDGQPGIDPIYLNPDIQSQEIGQMDRLVNELGHEIFHRMRPFGSRMITCLEEYWAFYVGAELVGAGTPNFKGIDPMNRDQLDRWFTTQGLPGYLRLPAYPGEAARGIKTVDGREKLKGE